MILSRPAFMTSTAYGVSLYSFLSKAFVALRSAARCAAPVRWWDRGMVDPGARGCRDPGRDASKRLRRLRRRPGGGCGARGRGVALPAR